MLELLFCIGLTEFVSILQVDLAQRQGSELLEKKNLFEYPPLIPRPQLALCCGMNVKEWRLGLSVCILDNCRLLNV